MRECTESVGEKLCDFIAILICEIRSNISAYKTYMYTCVHVCVYVMTFVMNDTVITNWCKTVLALLLSCNKSTCNYGCLYEIISRSFEHDAPIHAAV